MTIKTYWDRIRKAKAANPAFTYAEVRHAFKRLNKNLKKAKKAYKKQRKLREKQKLSVMSVKERLAAIKYADLIQIERAFEGVRVGIDLTDTDIKIISP